MVPCATLSSLANENGCADGHEQSRRHAATSIERQSTHPNDRRSGAVAAGDTAVVGEHRRGSNRADTGRTVDGAGEGALQISWQPAAGADAYVVYRTVDDSPDHWRARTSTLDVVDTDRTGVLQYSVVAISAEGERSAPTPCDDARLATVLTPPTTCVVTPSAGRLTVAWAAGNGAVEYIVSRSVDGGPIYWRGRTSQLSFDDSDRAGGLD